MIITASKQHKSEKKVEFADLSFSKFYQRLQAF